MKKWIPILEKKLGRENSYGEYHHDEAIYIDPRLSSKKRFDILLHELLHWRYPELTEGEVERGSRDIVRHLWKQGYRRVEIS